MPRPGRPAADLLYFAGRDHDGDLAAALRQARGGTGRDVIVYRAASSHGLISTPMCV